MTLTIGLTADQINTHYAPLAALWAHYRQIELLAPLEQVRMVLRARDFRPVDKLLQVLLSILAGCETLSEANGRLRSEIGLARVGAWERFADQSNLSRTLDALTLKQIEQLRHSTTAIWQAQSQVKQHDWRGYLWLDFDLSGLPCGPQAEASQKGYFSDKKTSRGAS
jgi:hypothetical protein